MYSDTHLNEELCIKRAWGRVKWSSLVSEQIWSDMFVIATDQTNRNSSVNAILGCYGVRSKQIHNLVRSKTSVPHPGKYLVGSIRRFWDGEIRSGAREVGAAGQEL